MRSGKLITFEGLDGCGKTTQLQKTQLWLAQQGYEVLSTREPGGTPIGRQIRYILLNPEHGALQAESELLLYLADRIQHLQELILPAKARGKIVLCDRFHDSTVAYQGYGRGLDLSSIESIVRKCINPYAPDLSFLLKISPETAALRLAQRQKQVNKDRLEAESGDFFERAAQGFQALATAEPERFVCIDGEQAIEIVHQNIVAVLRQHF